MKEYIYVDYENMSNLKNLLPGEDRKYFFFIGAEQKTIPSSLAIATNKVSVEWVKIEGQGKNALDFYIAYFIAKNDEQDDVKHFILSKDKGFDPLISYINKSKSCEIVRRIITLDELDDIQENEKDIIQKCEKVLDNLNSIQSARRPKSENKLKAHIHTFSKKENWKDEEIQKIIDELYRKKSISKGKNNRISYNI